MRNLSSNWKEKVKNGMDVQYLKYADITLTDGTVLNLTSADLWQNGMEFEDSVSGDSSFDIGSAIINVLNLSINNFDGEYSDYDFEGAEVICYVGMEFDDGTTEKIRICTATVVEQPEDETVTIDLICEDNIHKFDRNYSDSKLNYPATRGQIIKDACEVCGVTLQTTSFDRDDYIVQIRPDDEALTFRQVLQWVAQIGCQWLRCDEYGRLCINWYGGSVDEEELVVDVLGTLKTQNGSNIKLNFSSSDGVLSADNGVLLESNGVLRLFATDGKGNVSSIKTTYGFTPHHTDVVITGVKVTEYSESSSDNPQTYMAGTEGYVLGIYGNKLIRVGDGQTIASMIAEKCVGMRFRPFESECPTDVSLEAGDSLLIVDRTGKIYNSFLTSTTLQPGAGQRIACNAKSAAKNSSTRYSQATQAFVAARNMVKQEKTEREKALEEFGKRLDSATGVYTTVELQENGSKIFYLHDKPTLAESQAIWKMTSEAWGVSTDGGQTWNGGMTVDGDTIVRILNAVGVNATWINTGAITVKDANENILFQVDMDTKTVVINPDVLIIGNMTLSEKLENMDENIASAKNMTFQLSNDMQTITSDADGNIPVFPTVATTAKVMYGSNDITNDCSYTITKSDSVTGSWDVDTHTYTVTGLSADNGWVDIKAVYLNNLAVTKRFTVSKQKQGTDGKPGRTYIIESSCNVLKRSADNTISPNFLEFNAYYRDGDSATRYTYKGRFVIEETADGNTWTTIYRSTVDESTVKHYLYTILTDSSGQTVTDGNGTTVGIPRDITNIRCKLYASGGTTTLMDMQSVAVAVDVASLTQEQIVEILSNGGEFKGLYYLNEHLYISLDALMGNAAILGGTKNGNGYLKIKDANGAVKGLIDRSGYTVFTSYEENSKHMKYIGVQLSSDGIVPVDVEKFFDNEVDIEITNSEEWGISWDYNNLNIYATEMSANTGEFETLTVTDMASFTSSPKIENMEYTTASNTVCWDGRTGYKQLMLKSSSSKRYKDIGDNITESEIEGWYNIEPTWAKYKDGYLVKGDENEGRYIPMFIAEDVENFFPEATRHADGQVEDWNERIMIPAMFAMIKSQKSEINLLKQELNEIKQLLRKE
ncbi:Uncharacterised protein [uncultured Ruminococcus sp.]|nr:Uncharacterised protein [uncultured Ruminococcus sp.]